MDKAELKTKIKEVVDSNHLAAVATLENGKPWVRYMGIQIDDDLCCYAPTFAQSRKVLQIKNNNSVHITAGGDPNNWMIPYVNIVATGEILDDADSKNKVWQDVLKNFFSGPDDPNYVVLKATPQVIEYMIPGSMEPVVYTPDE
ncbi:MAG: pyridoxamine 5'-phosphate oxidase family protein [Candidatus Ancaeobacter aquaticus]|nr:pyridoxamine 5'-phosphate oxidase family protein [Candidatus Ancaeobacter aquaticus]